MDKEQTEEKSKMKLRSFENAAIFGHHETPGKDLVQVTSVSPSGLTDEKSYGGKCVHGIYIPASSPYQDRAEYCSVCRPYVIGEKASGL